MHGLQYAYAIIDLVSRKWIATILAPEATGVQVRVLFSKALAAEGLLSDDLTVRLADLDDQVIGDDDSAVPLLLAISDNGTEMKCRDTRKFMAVCSIVQHFGRPSTPTDQAWIETLGHVKYEHPHLLAITDPGTLAAELERIRVHYNQVRLHEAIGYVTPDDEHQGRGDAIRAARRAGWNEPTANAGYGIEATGAGHDHQLDSNNQQHQHHQQPTVSSVPMRSERNRDLLQRVRNGSLFERLAIDVLAETDISGACNILRISWDEAWHLMERAVARGQARKRAGCPSWSASTRRQLLRATST